MLAIRILKLPPLVLMIAYGEIIADGVSESEIMTPI